MALPTKKPLVWAGVGQRPRLLGRYHVLDEIGRNAVGPLYLARLEGPKGFQRWAAIRRVDKRHLTEDGYIARFYERVREGAKLLHPNVTALFDVGEDDGAPWVAMEYLHGERIEEAIGRLEFADTPASWEIAARVIADAADGLHAVHNLRDKEGAPLGLLHGDLAPHSLVVTYEGKTKIKGAFEPRVHGVLDPRKVPYAAPEQLFDGAVDARADVFALGVLLWELLAGKRLFARRTDDETRAMIEAGVVPPLVDLVEDIPMELDALVRRALMRSSSQRFPSARELSRELESLLVSKGVVARDDDVGRYMRTLFADRYTDQEARLHAAADVTEVFRRSQQSPTARALSAIAAIPDVSVKDEEDEGEETMLMDTSAQDDDHTTAERPASKQISGYTDEIVADSGPTNPRAAPLAPLNDTDEIPTMTGPQPSFVTGPKTTPRRKDSDDELTLTAPKIDPGSSASRLIMPSSLTSDPDVTESAIFVAPRIPAPTPPDTEAMLPQPPPPRPMMPSFPERPLLPSTPPTGVHAHDRAHIRPLDLAPWPPPPPPQPPFTPPPAFHTSRGPHAALSTSSLRAVLFPRDRARRVAVVSIVGSIGGALLFLAFFFVWRSLDQRVATTPASSGIPTPSSASARPTATASTPAPTASVRASAAPPVTVPQIPTLDLSQPPTHPRSHRNAAANTATSTTTTATTSTAATSTAKTTGFLTVMCKPASCDHILDGARDLGGSPLYKQEMSTGKHVLTLRVDTTHVQKTVTVDVADGETVTIRPDVSP